VPDALAEEERDGVGPVVEDAVVEDPVVDAPVVEDVAVGWWVGVTSCRDPLAGLSVATESIAPATRHTARMLASSGMMVPLPLPLPRSGAASRRSRLRRRFARSSRW